MMIKLNNGWVRLAMFSIVYTTFHVAYFYIPNEILADVFYQRLLGSVCVGVINLLLPAEAVMVVQNHMISAFADLEIVRGCDGAGAFFLVFAAILTYPANWRFKIAGLMLSCLWLYTLNIIRICVLYWLSAHYPQWFNPVHVYLAPTLFVLLSALFFLGWAHRATDKPYAV